MGRWGEQKKEQPNNDTIAEGTVIYADNTLLAPKRGYYKPQQQQQFELEGAETTPICGDQTPCAVWSAVSISEHCGEWSIGEGMEWILDRYRRGDGHRNGANRNIWNDQIIGHRVWQYRPG